MRGIYIYPVVKQEIRENSVESKSQTRLVTSASIITEYHQKIRTGR